MPCGQRLGGGRVQRIGPGPRCVDGEGTQRAIGRPGEHHRIAQINIRRDQLARGHGDPVLNHRARHRPRDHRRIVGAGDGKGDIRFGPVAIGIGDGIAEGRHAGLPGGKVIKAGCGIKLPAAIGIQRQFPRIRALYQRDGAGKVADLIIVQHIAADHRVFGPCRQIVAGDHGVVGQAQFLSIDQEPQPFDVFDTQIKGPEAELVQPIGMFAGKGALEPQEIGLHRGRQPFGAGHLQDQRIGARPTINAVGFPQIGTHHIGESVIARPQIHPVGTAKVRHRIVAFAGVAFAGIDPFIGDARGKAVIAIPRGDRGNSSLGFAVIVII